jgi:hypothetical protein
MEANAIRSSRRNRGVGQNNRIRDEHTGPKP